GMIVFGCLYFLTPKLWGRTQMHSVPAMNWHFWLAMIGIVLYAASMWVTGIMEGLMWREVDDQGFLVNSFADTVRAKFPMYLVRGLGGALYLTGALIMCWNMWRTIVGHAPARQSLSQVTPAE
ncbi:MAG: cbb3-type cytochrome c oxidase subunit I, partial [Pseudomonadota bacterium]